MTLKSQKRIAAEILKCGTSRIWIDPAKTKDVSQAITREDIRKLINEGVIAKIRKSFQKTVSRQRRQSRGSIKGAKKARTNPKKSWMASIRSLRKFLKELKTSGKIDSAAHKKLYAMAKGRMFRSRKHLELYLKEHKLIKEN